jgi:PadR family transcriptional regulator PadR
MVVGKWQRPRRRGLSSVAIVQHLTTSYECRKGNFYFLLLFAQELMHTSPKRFMGRPDANEGDLVQGTLDMLILKTLTRGTMHGYAIAESIQTLSEDALRVEEGALYPALHRLELRGLLASEWGLSENNRRAKYYKLTASGRKRLAAQAERWQRMTAAISRIMQTA